MPRNEQLWNLLVAERKALTRLDGVLAEIIEAARKREGDRIGTLADELVKIAGEVEERDGAVNEFIESAARERGMARSAVKLKDLDDSTEMVDLVDSLRGLLSSVARNASRVAGILSANVEIIQQTIQVLRGLESRAVGYTDSGLNAGSESSGGPAKMVDRTV